MSNLSSFTCLNCGRVNPIKGHSYTNKYCNNQCQQNHRKTVLAEQRLSNWLEGCGLYVWKEVPEYVKNFLIGERGHCCETCKLTTWLNEPIPLLVTQKDKDIYNNKKDNLELICPNCYSQK